MALEVAILHVIAGKELEFEAAFQTASTIITAATGYVCHQLHRCIEKPSQYILLVTWDSLAHHTQGFRDTADYQRWRALLHHF